MYFKKETLYIFGIVPGIGCFPLFLTVIHVLAQVPGGLASELVSNCIV